jgi:hypothetical protein
MDDLSKLTDEELDAKIAPTEEQEESPTTSEEDNTEVEEVEAAAESEEEAEEEKAEEETQGEEEASPQPSRRENLRIQKLLSKLKEQSQASAQPTSPKTDTGLDYSSALDADQEVISRLEADRQAYGNNLYQQGLEQAKSMQFHTRLEIDAPKVESKYPQLNPEDKTNFNPVVANAVNEWYLSTAGFDSTTGSVKNSEIRYADFVDSIMELSEELAARKNVNTAKNIAKQAATTGLRPDGSSAKRMNLNQAPHSMSDEELDAFLAKALPRR